ncbi:MAG: excinuclease ABC subunit UvrA [Bacteroidales bacterium]|nr:excinuclease ABC subunit UvrA [Bacteroidales bacterium]
MNTNSIEDFLVDPEDQLVIEGARVHNLQNISLTIPRNKLVVITGLSGSGKSSLAFDTIYAEGQRRYLETFSAYARQFIGNLERPDVDKITGLSPVVSIEQKTTNKNPRSTVGTITEVYDFLRLLFARTADAYSLQTGEKMVRYTEEQIVEMIMNRYSNKKIALLAPLIKGRKGHYRELFEELQRQGYLRVRVDGEILEMSPRMQVERYKLHDIELVIDRISVTEQNEQRLLKSIQTAIRMGKGSLLVYDFDDDQQSYFSRHLMCPVSGISYSEPEPNNFSFNSPYGACPHCKGLGEVPDIDLDKIFPDKTKSIRQGGIAPIGEYKNIWIFNQLQAMGVRWNFTLDTPISEISPDAIQGVLYGVQDGFKVQTKLETGVIQTKTIDFDGIVNFILTQYNETESANIKNWSAEFINNRVCPICHGTRLKEESLAFKINGLNIAEYASMDIIALKEAVDNMEATFDPQKATIAHEILRELKNRIGFLLDVGLDYLSLNQGANTLSGGESQRIRLATQIGSQLVGVLYILDEPSIGLHQRDNQRLIQSLCRLRDIGNSVFVVEHDEEMMRSADQIIDLGPGAGRFGGDLVAQGTPQEIEASDTLTGKYLSGSLKIPIPSVRRTGNGKSIVLKGASGNNLKQVNVTFPLGTMICVTGVSGSGKSTLINETLFPILSQHFYGSKTKPKPYKSITGLKNVDKVIAVDQAPIGRTPRSNPATYTKIFDDIRALYINLPESKIRGYKPGRFSFNVPGGRCETCKGAGLQTIEMNFLPDVYVECPDCHGTRYNRETLEVRYKGNSINDILNMTINQSVEFFENIPNIHRKLKALQDVGLGYVHLGQPSTTLSGGEAQRVKLATELSKKETGSTFYILDEPTTGLHFDDIRVLMEVLQRLTDRGNTVLIIEHNMDVIKLADYIIDLGPEGGKRGGEVLATGTPEEIAKKRNSITGKFLKNFLK